MLLLSQFRPQFCKHMNVLQLNRFSSLNRVVSCTAEVELKCHLNTIWMDNVLPIYSMHAEPSKSIISQHSTSQASASSTAPLQGSRIKQAVFSEHTFQLMTCLCWTGSPGLYQWKSCASFFMALYTYPFATLQQLQRVLLWTRHWQSGWEDTDPLGSCASLSWLWILHDAATGKCQCSTYWHYNQLKSSTGYNSLWCLRARLCWRMCSVNADKCPTTQQTTAQPNCCFDPCFSHIPPVTQGWLLGL